MVALSSLALKANQGGNSSEGKQVAPITEFIEAPWGLNMRLFPVQKVILKAHYGLELDDKERFDVTDWRRTNPKRLTEKEYLKYLFEEGRCNIGEVIPGVERREMILSIGRRSGKTTISACIAAYETYKLISKGDPQKYYGLPKSNNIQIISVATDKDQAGLLYQEVSGHYKNCSFFGPYTANNTQSYARFQTPIDIERYGAYIDDQNAKATIKITFRSCVAKGLRGAGNIVVILDEVAHFTDAGQSGADAVYNAVVPSTSAFSPKDSTDPRIPIGPVEGRVILISSPLGKQGMFYKLFNIGMGSSDAAKNMLCVQAPTWEVNPTVPAGEFEKHYQKDATVFFTEYGGVFTDRTRGWIEDAKDLEACIDETLKPQKRGAFRQSYFMGLDLGLVGDGTAIAIGHINQEGKIVLDLVDQIKAGEGNFEDRERLDFDDVADWIEAHSKKFLIQEGVFDQWAGIPLEQALEKRGLKQMKSLHLTKALNSQIYQNFKDMIWDKRLALYNEPREPNEEYCDYIKELLELQADRQSKHVVIVEAPKIAGKHDDQSDAIARMIWLATQKLGKQAYVSKGGGADPRIQSALRRKASLRARRSGSHPSRMVSKKSRR